MGAAWLWFFLIGARKREHSDETAFAAVLWMLYMMIGGILFVHGVEYYEFPPYPSLLVWIVCQLIVLRWSFKKNAEWNQNLSKGE